MDIRDNIIDIVRKAFIGPDPIEGYCQPNGEEIIRNISPKSKYTAGVLHQSEEVIITPTEENESETDDDLTLLTEIDEAKSEMSNTMDNNQYYKTNEINIEIEEEIVTLANEKLQSTFSFTCVISDIATELLFQIDFGLYDIHKNVNISSGKEETSYYRKGYSVPLKVSRHELPQDYSKIKYFSVYQDHLGRKLDVAVTKRESPVLKSGSMYTLSLINNTVGKVKFALPEFFQCKMSVTLDDKFLPLAESRRVTSDEEFLSNNLLYRSVSNYAIGHGCAVVWDASKGSINTIGTESIPEYEMKYIVPSDLPNLQMSMDYYRKAEKKEAILELLNFTNEYELWIRNTENKIDSLNESYKKIAHTHMSNCRKCLKRMNEGIDALKDERVHQAFKLTNEAMLLQQIHYRIPLIGWSSDNGRYILNDNSGLPDIDNPKTWYGDQSRYGKWRPFQIAFILMNIISMTNPTSQDREVLDLIWFPTGGGKTEAYLGLSAFTILYNRLINLNHVGTDILMRYTLRLLTTQQYERASSLICALEKIRLNNVELLGENRISIGLWVGQSLSDNTTADALRNLKRLQQSETEDNRFLILKCPWCGAEMGVIKQDKGHKVIGYSKAINSKDFQFVCGNKKCDYSSPKSPLPLEIIDEQIYNNTPSIIIGTVDKFAVLPFNPNAKSIFGIDSKNQNQKPPSLIIQDELHLISGPLGSMVGFYEFMIKELCGKKINNKMVHPKIIASTATISNAKQQCQDLYGITKENVFQFPPQGIDYNDSFFAKEDTVNPGRKYVGIKIPDSSTAMTDIKLYASLVYAGREVKLLSEEYNDSYWTILAYFNSLKDLGQTKTWVYSSIPENLASIYVARKDFEKEGYKENRRFINTVEELTSRVRNSDISRVLQRLSTPYNPNNKFEAVDLCLSSNMISVGIDIPRLALMTVSGQPKTTAEYIQATSRVGRGRYPGLVFTHYYKSRPRDISHYEQFQSYHSKIYTYVEPTSVTPYSPQVRERALHAVLVALYRILENDENPSIIPDDDFMQYFKKQLKRRVELIDSNEWSDIETEIENLLISWDKIHPQRFSTYTAHSEEIPLIYSSGIIPHDLWGNRGWKTQSSMRNVDLMCKPKQVGGSGEDE